MAWGAEGYQLMVAEAASSAHVLELSLAKSLRGSHRVLSGDTSPQDRYCQVQQEVHVLLVSGGQGRMRACVSPLSKWEPRLA